MFDRESIKKYRSSKLEGEEGESSLYNKHADLLETRE